ncbi:type I DNA topoisomerase [Patescibacteria group bacterium]|nr:type I DNA topoisomerase [Patescibacteria group bacterium]
MNLVIVESPTKTKKIAKFLGKGYQVLSSKGHIYDLPKSGLGVDVEHKFKPVYEEVKNKHKVITELKKAAKSASKVFLATDLDREGEAIAWHVVAAMMGKISGGIKPTAKYRRVVFSEITKEAVLAAFKKPRDLNEDLYDAQKARRILDRLVGYKLSPLLWKKIRYGLSAGRVQSVGVRLIVEREKEREKFKEQGYYRVKANLSPMNEVHLFEAELVSKNDKKYEEKKEHKLFAGNYLVTKTSISSKKQAQEIIDDLSKQGFIVQSVEKRKVKQNPYPPYATASLQRAASNQLGFSSKQTMRLAQKLYEEGFITYHRTDSTKLSEQFIEMARAYVQNKFGKQFVSESARRYQTKSKTAQEAHEAIRPTVVEGFNEAKAKIAKKLGENEVRLFELIWRQAVSSQGAAAVYEQLTVLIKAGPYLLRTGGRTLEFEGWKKIVESEKLKACPAPHGAGVKSMPRDEAPSDGVEVLRGDNVNNEEAEVPLLREGQRVDLKKAFDTEHQTQAPPRYTEASLIRDLETHGIGRPSTYAAIISTIQGRNYVDKDGNYFYPEDTGIVVSDLLAEHFPDIVDLKFTAAMEENLDTVARGQAEWVPMLRDFYKPFEKLLEKKMKEIKKEDVVVMEKTKRKCPDCGALLVVKLGKYGKFISCSNYPKCEYAEFLDDEHTPENEGAVDKNQLKGQCPECDGKLELKQGKFGRFIACGNYPKCKFTKNYLEKIGMKCPDCKDGEVIVKRTRKGRIFYGCSGYPKCKYASWKNPLLGEK